MTKDPVIDIIESDAQKTVINGGLHYINGNDAPYFSLTCSFYERNQFGTWKDVGGGANHTHILRLRPDLVDLAAMHLSDADGVPLHAKANGFYWLAGACGGMKQKFHGGTGDSAKSQDECLKVFAAYMRIPMETARTIAGEVVQRFELHGPEYAKTWFEDWVEQQKPRWKQEAEKCISKHGLEFYGDPLPAQYKNPGM